MENKMTAKEEFIVLINTDIIQKSDVIVILEGDGFSRYKKAVELYRSEYAPKICFSGGFDDKKSGAYTYDLIKPHLLNEGVNEEDLLLEDKSKNTYEQAVEIVKMAKLYNWKRIIIVASHYHIYRAFLTFLHERNKNMPELIVDVAKVDYLDWFEDTGYGRRIDLLQEEFKKIDLYQNKDNVASYEDGVEYLRWKFREQKR